MYLLAKIFVIFQYFRIKHEKNIQFIVLTTEYKRTLIRYFLQIYSDNEV